MLQYHHQNAGQNWERIIAKRLSENVQLFKYLETTVTNKNLIEEIKRRLNSGNACYQLVQNLPPSRLLSGNVKIRIYRTID
jgi:hypothetical protein